MWLRNFRKAAIIPFMNHKLVTVSVLHWLSFYHTSLLCFWNWNPERYLQLQASLSSCTVAAPRWGQPGHVPRLCKDLCPGSAPAVGWPLGGETAAASWQQKFLFDNWYKLTYLSLFTCLPPGTSIFFRTWSGPLPFLLLPPSSPSLPFPYLIPLSPYNSPSPFPPFPSPSPKSSLGSGERCKLPMQGRQRICMYFRLGNRRWWWRFSVVVKWDKCLQMMPY